MKKKEQSLGELDDVVLSNIVSSGGSIDESITPLGEITSKDPNITLDKMDYCRQVKQEIRERYFRTNPNNPKE